MLTKAQVTVQDFAAGAVWLPSPATVTVTFTVPLFCPLLATVTTLPLRVTVIVLGEWFSTLIAPVELVSMVKVPESVPGSRRSVAGLRDSVPAALPMLYATVLAVSVPSGQQ